MTTPSDHERFVGLLEEHRGILYKVAFTYCRRREDRPDLIQEMTVQLWRSFDRFDGRAKFSTWMYRIAMNVAISFHRSERRRIRDAVPIDTAGLDLAAADRVMDEAGEDLRTLLRRMEAWDEMSRALVLLHLEGYRHEEIGQIIGVSTANVATRLHRIRERLQRELDRP
ncbi:MAG TPA: RNA polymerase sigma factor [Candidatus Eisenbacteria bacterium]|nr:RNA polymerase sigma factor [Candidatus Eisenbacteria bacterium]